MRFVVENKIYDKEETLDRSELRSLQLTRLKETIKRLETVPFYKEIFARERIREDKIRTLDDIKRLPFTTKEDLRKHYPLGFLAVDRSKLVRIHGSSGTTGRPTFVAYTKEDMDTWSRLCARFLVAGGLRPDHFVHIAFGYGLFTGGFGLHQAVERIGACVIPAGSGNTRRQIMLIQDLQPDVLICTPSYALTIADTARQEGIDASKLSLKYGHFGGEQWTDKMREQIEKELGIVAFNNYGLSEVIGPGVSGECAARVGMHIQEDHFIVECIDPDTLEPVKMGERGELVITTITKQAMPLLRYRTRDITSLDDSPCPCGRKTVRMGRVVGRSDDMLIIRGVNVFPSQIEEALLHVEGISPHYLIEIDRPGNLDEITVKVEVSPEIFSDKMSQMQSLKEKIDMEIYTITGIRANIELVEPNTIERSFGKAKRVIDHRKEKGII